MPISVCDPVTPDRHCWVLDARAVEQRFGMAFCRLVDEASVTELTLQEWMRLPDGSFDPHVVSVLLDHHLGEAVFRARPAHTWSVTSQLTTETLAGVPSSATTLVSRVSAQTVDKLGGWAAARVQTDAGDLVAAGTTWANFIDVEPGAERVLLSDAPGLAMSQPVDPAARNVREAIGAHVVAVPGGAHLQLDHPGRWLNLFGTVHGGVWAVCAQEAARTALAARPELTPASTTIVYQRPADAHRPVRVHAEVIGVSRSQAIVRAVGYADADRPCIQAMITARRARG